MIALHAWSRLALCLPVPNRSREEPPQALAASAPSTALDLGSPGWFEALFHAELDFVVRSLLRLGVKQKDVEDVAQEVFLQVAKKASTYEAGRPVRAWLWGFARRLASDYRDLARHRYEHTQDDDHALGTANSDPLSDAMSAESKSLIHQALLKLPEERREVVILYELEEMTLQEIADLTGTSINTIASRLRKGREELAVVAKALQAQHHQEVGAA